MDEFKFMKVFSSIDEQGRYAYGNQMTIAEWNILRFAESILPLIDEDPEKAVEKIRESLEDVLSNFANLIQSQFTQKLGFKESNSEIETLSKEFLNLLEKHSLDFTLSFSNLRNLYEGDQGFFPSDSQLESFFTQWKNLGPDLSLLESTNPKLIPRNHQIEAAIKRAEQGNYEPVNAMWEALKSPFEVSPEHQYLLEPPRTDEKVYQTFCGT